MRIFPLTLYSDLKTAAVPKSACRLVNIDFALLFFALPAEED